MMRIVSALTLPRTEGECVSVCSQTDLMMKGVCSHTDLMMKEVCSHTDLIMKGCVLTLT